MSNKRKNLIISLLTMGVMTTSVAFGLGFGLSQSEKIVGISENTKLIENAKDQARNQQSVEAIASSQVSNSEVKTPTQTADDIKLTEAINKVRGGTKEVVGTPDNAVLPPTNEIVKQPVEEIVQVPQQIGEIIKLGFDHNKATPVSVSQFDNEAANVLANRIAKAYQVRDKGKFDNAMFYTRREELKSQVFCDVVDYQNTTDPTDKDITDKYEVLREYQKVDRNNDYWSWEYVLEDYLTEVKGEFKFQGYLSQTHHDKPRTATRGIVTFSDDLFDLTMKCWTFKNDYFNTGDKDSDYLMSLYKDAIGSSGTAPAHEWQYLQDEMVRLKTYISISKGGIDFDGMDLIEIKYFKAKPVMKDVDPSHYLATFKKLFNSESSDWNEVITNDLTGDTYKGVSENVWYDRYRTFGWEPKIGRYGHLVSEGLFKYELTAWKVK